MRVPLRLLLAAPLAATVLLAGCGSSTPLLPGVSGSASISTTSASSSTTTSSTRSSSGASGGLSASHDPCQLLTASDIEGVISGSYTKVQGTANVCGYADVSTSSAVAISTADLPGGSANASAAVNAAAQTAGGTVHSVSGLGDAAAVASNSGKTLVAFVKSGTLVVVVLQGSSISDPESKAEALAQKVAGKL